MIEILRLARRGDLITAEVFEELFARQVGGLFSVRPIPLVSWCSAVLDPPGSSSSFEAAAGRFAAATRGSHFLCPNYESVVLAPLLLALRNRARAPIRLLLIAHAPGACAFEWALLPPLLRTGDRIVAPSESARATIEYLCGDLAPWIRVVPHPMAPLPQPDIPRTESRIVSLGRINGGKLLHRQIEAMDVLRSRHRDLPLMQIAGALEEGGGPGPSAYARVLTEKVRRLRLDDRVRLVGPIRGAAAKSVFLSGARFLLNLSVTIEESFGKAPIEALGLGVPVLATRWDGLSDTVGDCGVLVPVSAAHGVAADVSADAIADAIDQLMGAPPSREACVAQVARFAPSAILPQYRAVLEEALEATARCTSSSDASIDDEWPAASEPAAPRRGLLSVLPPLTRMAWTELFEHYAGSCVSVRAAWEGATPSQACTGDLLRGIVLASTKRPMEAFLAGLVPTSSPVPARQAMNATGFESDFIERLAESAASPGLSNGRLACLGQVRDAGRVDLLRCGLEHLDRDGLRGSGVTFLRVEAHALAGDHEAAFDACLAGLDLTVDTEVTATGLRQLARIARRWRRPSLALPVLAQWLDRFPDSPQSGGVWLDSAVTMMQSPGVEVRNARLALERAGALLGDVPVLGRVATLLAFESARRAAEGSHPSLENTCVPG